MAGDRKLDFAKCDTSFSLNPIMDIKKVSENNSYVSINYATDKKKWQ